MSPYKPDSSSVLRSVQLCNVTMQGSNELLKERAEAAELRRKLADVEDELVKVCVCVCVCVFVFVCVTESLSH